ncbi:MAG: DUF2059 domain-containing protein [Pseudomonadota bacterium]
MLKRILLLAVLLTNPFVTFAGPSGDATFIAQQHIAFGGYAERLAELEAEVFNNLEPAIERLGAKVIDPVAFTKELTGQFTETFLPSVLISSADGFEKILTPQELSELAQFYRSEAGQKFLAKSPTAIEDFDRFDFFRSGPGAPLIEHYPELTANMEQVVSQGLATINASFNMDRLAKILENPGIVTFDDEETRARVVAGVRSAE